MTAEPSIIIENLSKIYHLRNGIETSNGKIFELKALDNINLIVQQGEIIGITGPNGSGKSTLLKILAGVTKPTSGRAYLKGRVASILDIGAGFHPELTGRENIFISGEVIGFSKKEIKQRFDDIVAFSGIERFIDEPVKNYSNGMYLRLAFSIIIHLHCDILLLDEVLAVGDQDFMKKCLAAIKQKQHEGVTILIVSHDRELLSYMTNKIVTIKDQELALQHEDFFDTEERFKADPNIKLSNIHHHLSDNQLILEIELTEMSGYESVDIGISFDLEQSVHNRFIISSLHSNVKNNDPIDPKLQKYIKFNVSIPTISLKPGVYWLSVYVIKNKRTITSNFNQCYHIDIPATDMEDYFLHFYPNPLRMFFDWTKTY